MGCSLGTPLRRLRRTVGERDSAVGHVDGEESALQEGGGGWKSLCHSANGDCQALFGCTILCTSIDNRCGIDQNDILLPGGARTGCGAPRRHCHQLMLSPSCHKAPRLCLPPRWCDPKSQERPGILGAAQDRGALRPLSSSQAPRLHAGLRCASTPHLVPNFAMAHEALQRGRDGLVVNCCRAAWARPCLYGVCASLLTMSDPIKGRPSPPSAILSRLHGSSGTLPTAQVRGKCNEGVARRNGGKAAGRGHMAQRAAGRSEGRVHVD